MSRDHDHHHTGSGGTMLAVAIWPTPGFAVVEAEVGPWAGSPALVADAGHGVSDAAGIGEEAGERTDHPVACTEKAQRILTSPLDD